MNTFKDINGNRLSCNLEKLVERPSAIKEGSETQGKELLINCVLFEPVKDTLFEQAVNDPSKRLIVKGVLQRAEVKNQNGRVYPYEVLAREVTKYTQNFIKERRAVGELDHPETSVVNLKNVSHNLLEAHWEGQDLIGTVEILDTPNGNILRSLLKSGIRLGISSRGLGTVKKTNEGVDLVSEDFELIAFDFVSNPSTDGAFMFPAGRPAESRKLNESIKRDAPIIPSAEQLLKNVQKVVLDDYINGKTHDWISRHPRFISAELIASGKA